MLIRMKRVTCWSSEDCCCGATSCCLLANGRVASVAFSCFAAGLSSCPRAACESAASASTQNRIMTTNPAFSPVVLSCRRILILLCLYTQEEKHYSGQPVYD